MMMAKVGEEEGSLDNRLDCWKYTLEFVEEEERGTPKAERASSKVEKVDPTGGSPPWEPCLSSLGRGTGT